MSQGLTEKEDFEKIFCSPETVDMTSDGLVEMFEGDFADMCANGEQGGITCLVDTYLF